MVFGSKARAGRQGVREDVGLLTLAAGALTSCSDETGGTGWLSTHFNDGVVFPDDKGVGHEEGEIPEEGAVLVRAPRSEITRLFDGVAGSVFGELDGPPGVLRVERLNVLRRPAPATPLSDSSPV